VPKRRIISDLTVSAVAPNSPAERAGVLVGDHLEQVNGRPARDGIDFMFESIDEIVRLDLRRGTVVQHVALLREPGESLGLEFHDRALDQIITCNNKCPFCFLAGLKPGMRKTLYIKDDDYRLSFLHGNFITLSNLTEDDWQRLEEQRLSPLYVSVHATEPELRHRMLGNTRANDINQDLDRLARAGIRVHTQLVVIPNINDGDHIERSIGDLARHYPTVQSISVVPVGVTRFNFGREQGNLRPQTEAEARALIRQIQPWQRRFRADWGIDFVYLSDEVYLRAGKPVPSASRYDGYAQYENGVGMTRWLLEEHRLCLRRQARAAPVERPIRAGVICGAMAAPVLRPLAESFSEATGIQLSVHEVLNDFWGHTVWISGLLAGQDIARQVADQTAADLYFVTPKSLDASGTVFIDDWTPARLAETLGAPVLVAQSFSEIDRQVRDWLRDHATGDVICAGS
jgi:putative radical SAM enzyme (TIGR03279 family)